MSFRNKYKEMFSYSGSQGPEQAPQRDPVCTGGSSAWPCVYWRSLLNLHILFKGDNLYINNSLLTKGIFVECEVLLLEQFTPNSK